MLKKLLCAALAFLMVLGCAGCGSSDSTKPSDQTDTSQQSGKTDAPKQENSGKTSKEVTVDEQVLVDEGGVKITATGYDAKGFWGPELKLLIENNTEQNIIVGTSALIVNNYMVSDLFSEDVAAGKKANASMSVLSSTLDNAGIDTVGQIEVDFHIMDEGYNTILNPGMVTVKTSAYDSMDTTPNDLGKELYNANGIRIVGKYVDQNSFWGTAVLVYIENNSGRNIMISGDDLSVNGFMVDGSFYCEVYDGKMCIDDITIFDSSLKENNITDIEEIEVSFRIADNDTWDTIDETGPITMTPEK